jgi:hypothetical protein
MPLLPYDCRPPSGFPAKTRRNPASQPWTPAIKSSIAVLSPRLCQLLNRGDSQRQNPCYRKGANARGPVAIQAAAHIIEIEMTSAGVGGSRCESFPFKTRFER